MVQLIVGDEGKGKTKILLDRVNAAAAKANGNVVFLDKDNSHMYELKNTIRLVNTTEYNIDNAAAFVGFVAGIISSDHDLEELYIDRLLKVARIDASEVEKVVASITSLCDRNSVNCTISMSIAKDALPVSLQDKVVVSL